MKKILFIYKRLIYGVYAYLQPSDRTYRPVAISKWFHHVSPLDAAGKAVYKPIYNHDTGNKDSVGDAKAMVKLQRSKFGENFWGEHQKNPIDPLANHPFRMDLLVIYRLFGDFGTVFHGISHFQTRPDG